MVGIYLFIKLEPQLKKERYRLHRELADMKLAKGCIKSVHGIMSTWPELDIIIYVDNLGETHTSELLAIKEQVEKIAGIAYVTICEAFDGKP
jgi:hypothetical protein